jgi:hypothetical protein
MPTFLVKLGLRLANHTSKEPDARGCLLWTGGTDRDGYGRARVTWPVPVGGGDVPRSKVERVPRVIYRLKTGGVDIPRQQAYDGVTVAVEVSHLCHNRLCVTPEHLVLEPHLINAERQHCVQQGRCTHHGVHPDCLLQPH